MIDRFSILYVLNESNCCVLLLSFLVLLASFLAVHSSLLSLCLFSLPSCFCCADVSKMCVRTYIFVINQRVVQLDIL
jgi:hypothetical protein